MRQESWTFGPFELDAVTFRLSRDGQTVPLEPKALDVLRLLLERAPAVVSKEDIFDAVWKDVAVTDNALTRVIAQLRKALDDDARHPRYIETVATRGYRMAEAVSASVGARPRAAPVVAEVMSPTRHRGANRSRHVRLGLIAGVSFVVATSAAVAWRTSPRGGAASATDLVTEPDVVRFAALHPVQLPTGGTYDAQPALSTDGGSVAFTSDRTGTLEIFVQGLAPGSTPVSLTNNGRQNIQPAWSPDGQFIAYADATNGGIWIVPSRGGTPRRLTETGARPAWSPDGRRIAFHTLPPTELGSIVGPGSASTIGVADVVAGTVRSLTQPFEPEGPHVVPTWSADSTRVYFAATAPSFIADTRFWSIGVDGGGLRLEAQTNQATADFAMTPDGRGAYVTSRNTAALLWQPFVAGGALVPPRPTGLPLDGRPAHMSVSRDGTMLLWMSSLDQGRLMATTLPKNGTAAEDADPLPVANGVRAVTARTLPDGRLAYSAAVRFGSPQLWLGAPHGSAYQVTLDDGDHYVPFWTPDRRELVFLSAHKGRQTVNAVDIETRVERELFPLADLPLPDGGSLNSVVMLNVIPNNALSRIVFTVVKDGTANLWSVALKDGRPSGSAIQLTAETGGASFPHVSEDDGWVAYQCVVGADTQACVIRSDGTDRRQLTTTPGQRFIGSWKGSEAVLVASLERQVWNIVQVDRQSGVSRALTAFTRSSANVRYPRWDAVNEELIFDRTESTSRVWSVRLPSRTSTPTR